MLTVMPIGATQLGWYLYDQQTGFDFGMIVGASTVIYAAWLMYEKGWREEDEDILNNDFSPDKEQLSNELSKLNELLQSGVLTQEEFEKAKKKY